MRPFSTIHLRALAEAYCAATGDTLHALGARATGHPKLFKRLTGGLGCSAENAERASQWFAANWPADVPWPAGVPAPDCTSPTLEHVA